MLLLEFDWWLVDELAILLVRLFDRLLDRLLRLFDKLLERLLERLDRFMLFEILLLFACCVSVFEFALDRWDVLLALEDELLLAADVVLFVAEVFVGGIVFVLC